MSLKKLVYDGLMVNSASLVRVSIVRVDLFLLGGECMKSSVACFGRTDVVLQTDRDSG